MTAHDPRASAPQNLPYAVANSRQHGGGAAVQARSQQLPAVFATGERAALPPSARREEPNPDEYDDRDESSKFDAVRSAPPWLISMVMHMTLLLVLGLLVFRQEKDPSFVLEVEYASDLGEQLDHSLMLSADDPLEVPTAVLTPEDLPLVDDPLAAPPDLALDDFLGTMSLSEMAVPQVGLALIGRDVGMQQSLLDAYGGNDITQGAVELALEWLRRNQQRNGSWSLRGPYDNGAVSENVLAATAMALLAFQGAGHTHQSGEYQEQVAAGWRFLLGQLDEDGNFWKTGVHDHRLYSQAQATIALCELYGMSADEELREPAQRAIDYAIRIQSAEGGWRYHPGVGSDTSVTGWFVMALQSGLMAGLEVPSPALAEISGYLDRASHGGGSQYAYVPGYVPTPAMTAEGLLCRQYLGWEQEDERLQKGVEVLLDNPIDFDKQDVYYWYYATQVLHHMEGDSWDRWNQVMRVALPAHQVRSGAEAGSWDPMGDRWHGRGGRLYTTCLCTYMLEVYYRHLPIYSNLYGEIQDE